MHVSIQDVYMSLSKMFIIARYNTFIKCLHLFVKEYQLMKKTEPALSELWQL